jgi:hypothetical protein
MSNSNIEALLNSIPCSGVGIAPKLKMSDQEYEIYIQYNKETIEAIRARVDKTLMSRWLSGWW